MNLLQELEKSVEQLRSEQAAQAVEHERRAEVWRKEMAPAMHAVEDYLRQLMERLSQINERPRLSFSLQGYGDISAYIDRGYSLQSTPGAWQHEITLSYSAEIIPEECPVIAANTMAAVRVVAAALQQHRLGGMYNARRNENGEVVSARFRAHGKFSMTLSVLGEARTGQILFTFTNHEGFGQTQRTFTPQQINDELLDQLGRFIARDRLRFAIESLPLERLRALRERIESERARRGRAGMPLPGLAQSPRRLPPWLQDRTLFAPLRQLVQRIAHR